MTRHDGLFKKRKLPGTGAGTYGTSGASPVVSLILLLTIIFVITGGMMYWGMMQIGNIQESTTYATSYRDLTQLNKQLEAMSYASESNTGVVSYSPSNGEFSVRNNTNRWMFRYETSSYDFTDNFDDGVAEFITPQLGTGTVKDGWYRMTTSSGFASASVNSEKMTDVKISARVKLTGGSDPNDWIGFHVRMPSPTSSPITGGYTLMYDRSGNMIIMSNGVILVQTSTALTPDNIPRKMEITVFDRNITFRVENTVLKFSSATVSSGYIALVCGGTSTVGEFDDVMIHPTGYLMSSSPESGEFSYYGSGDYIKVLIPDPDRLDWWTAEGWWKYRIPVEFSTSSGGVENYPVDIKVDLTSLIPPGEHLDWNSIRVISGEGMKSVPYQMYSTDDTLHTTPSTVSRIDYIDTPLGGGGVLATDGKYIYVKRWGTSSGSALFCIYGTGLYGTERGRYYGTISGTYRTDTISAFYASGRIYNGYTPDGYNLQVINIQDGSVDYVSMTSPLIDRTSGSEITGGSSNILITTDGRYIYNIATSSGGSVAGYRMKVFSLDGTFLYEWKKTTPSVTAYGAVCDGHRIMLVSSTGIIVSFISEPGRTGDGFTSWVFPGNDGNMANGQYDYINNVIYLSSRTGDKIQMYEGRNYDHITWIAEGYTPPYTERKYYIYFDVFSDGMKEKPNFALPSMPGIVENVAFKDYTLENSYLRVSLKEGSPPVGTYMDHIYELVDKRTGRSLMRTAASWGWMVFYWNYGGIVSNPFDGITDIVPVSEGPVFAKVKMVWNTSNFVYERYYTIYRDVPMIQIQHRIHARTDFSASGGIYVASWWCPGRGDSNSNAVDHAYGMGGHDFGTDANYLGKEFTSKDYLGWTTRSLTVSERENAWYVDWNETNGEGIGTIWDNTLNFPIRVYSSPTSTNEGRGIYLYFYPPALRSGENLYINITGYVFAGDDGRIIKSVASAIHSIKPTLDAPEESPYRILRIDSYPYHLSTGEVSDVIIEVYMNDTSRPIYGFSMFSMDEIVQNVELPNGNWKLVLFNFGIATDYPDYHWKISDEPLIFTTPEEGSYTFYFVNFITPAIQGGTPGKYDIRVKLLYRESFVSLDIVNLTITFSGDLGEVFKDYLLSMYYEYIHRPELYTSYSGFAPTRDFYGNECVGLTGREGVDVKFVMIGEMLDIAYGG